MTACSPAENQTPAAYLNKNTGRTNLRIAHLLKLMKKMSFRQ